MWYCRATLYRHCGDDTTWSRRVPAICDLQPMAQCHAIVGIAEAAELFAWPQFSEKAELKCLRTPW